MDNDNSCCNFEKDTSNIINGKILACSNNYFRKEIWTGNFAQITLMSIPAGGEIGLEIHHDLDQIFMIEYGVATVYTGKTKNSVVLKGCANNECIVVIPAGTFHNLINEQNVPLKLLSIYAPPNHPIGTIHTTKFESDLEEY